MKRAAPILTFAGLLVACGGEPIGFDTSYAGESHTIDGDWVAAVTSIVTATDHKTLKSSKATTHVYALATIWSDDDGAHVSLDVCRIALPDVGIWSVLLPDEVVQKLPALELYAAREQDASGISFVTTVGHLSLGADG